ncbi:MAG: hypothetical protein IH977_07535 [Nitrospinae bacterium]|nr:hypothetical protein [Nitrospinota bacterium]
MQDCPISGTGTTTIVVEPWPRHRQELLDWLKREAPSLAELYEGALHLLFKSRVPGGARFISHAVREIRNRLPDEIAGYKASSHVQYKNSLDAISKSWEKEGLSLNVTTPNSLGSAQPPSMPSPYVSIPKSLFDKIEILVIEHNAGRETRKESAYRLFEAISPENKSLKATMTPVIFHWLEVTEWFMGKTHDSGKLDSDFDWNEIQQKFELFEAALGALVRGFFQTVGELDEILEDTNT